MAAKSQVQPAAVRPSARRAEPGFPTAGTVHVEPAAYGPSVEAVAAGRPSHIIVYKDSVENVASEFHKTLKVAGAKATVAGGKVAGIAAQKDVGGAAPRALELLNIVTCSLTEGEHQKLLASDKVEAVLPNLQRFIMAVPGAAESSHRPRPAQPSDGPDQPDFQGGRGRPSRGQGSTGGPIFPFGSTAGPLFPFGSASGPTYPFGSTGGPTYPFGSTGGPVFPFETSRDLLAYLAGQRDAYDALLFRLAARAAPAAQPQARAASGLTWGLTAIGVRGASGQATGKGIKVAILDTGLDITHPDWVNNAVANDTKGNQTRSFVPGVTSIMDGHGHGTHTAGTLGGPLTSVGGTRYGVAPDCDLYIGKVLDDSGSGFDSDILAGIEWALTSGCRVISMSLGSVRQPNEAFSPKYETTARRVLDLNDGALIIAAAGNESMRSQGSIAPVGNPAACPSIMAIAAIDSNLQVADFSCGQVDAIGLVDLAAPGVGVLSSYPVSKGRFIELNGTSMATPHVAGIAACLLQAEPTLTARALWARMLAGAGPLGFPPIDVGRGLARM